MGVCIFLKIFLMCRKEKQSPITSEFRFIVPRATRSLGPSRLNRLIIPFCTGRGKLIKKTTKTMPTSNSVCIAF